MYSEHRNYINQVVKLANKQNDDIENKAENLIKSDSDMFIFIVLFIVAGVSVLCLFIIRNIAIPLRFLKNHIQIIAKGDLSNDIPWKWLTAKDELGDITNATNEIEFSVGNVANKANEVKIQTDKMKQSTEDLKGLVAKFNA